jgi:hypothetical protein
MMMSTYAEAANGMENLLPALAGECQFLNFIKDRGGTPKKGVIHIPFKKGTINC